MPGFPAPTWCTYQMSSYEDPSVPPSATSEGKDPESYSVGAATQVSVPASRNFSGSQGPSPEDGNRHREGRAGPAGDVRHLGSGPDSRVWLPEHVDRLEQRLIEAFEAGDPAQAWSISSEMLHALRDSTDQAARERYRATFGSARCLTCTGLHAGTGVTATCFQLKCCYYRNLAETNTSPRLARALSKLGSGEKK